MIANAPPQNIEYLCLKSWDEILGNADLKEYLKDLIYMVRCEGHRTGFNALITGESRSGKTAAVEYGMKCLGCFDFDFETLEACGKCWNCTSTQQRSGNRDWENWCNIIPPEMVPTPIEYHYAPVDCTLLDQKSLNELTFDLEENQGMLNVIYLDEVHRLCSRNMDEKLLKPMEQFEAIWIASSAYADRDDGSGRRPLEKMLQNRFTYRITTEKPSEEELMIWLAERCDQFGIKVESPKTTLRQLAERSNRLPGMALQVVNKAYKKRNKTLTMKILDKHVFDFDDGILVEETAND